MNVYVIQKGSIDQEQMSFASVWKTKRAAIDAAVETAKEIVSDYDEGMYEVVKEVPHRISDDYVVAIEECRSQEYVDWWIITEEKVRQ